MVSREDVLRALGGVTDPEVPIDIVSLGLVYDVRVGESGIVVVDLTLTSAGCPAGAAFEHLVKSSVMALEGVEDVYVNVVWDPPWTPSRATEEGKLMLSALGVNVD